MYTFMAIINGAKEKTTYTKLQTDDFNFNNNVMRIVNFNHNSVVVKKINYNVQEVVKRNR